MPDFVMSSHLEVMRISAFHPRYSAANFSRERIRNIFMFMQHLLFLLLAAVAAQPLASEQGPYPDEWVTDRPSASRPRLPTYESPEKDSGFALPPIPPETRPLLKGRGGRRFVLRGFRFSGNTVFSDAKLQAVAAPFVGQPITMADLEELRYRLTLLYVKNGYVNSGVVLPDQRVSDGILRYRVIEGRLSDIRIEGSGRLRPDYVRDRLLLGAGPPLNTNELQERFQLLLADPLFERLNGSLLPGPVPGESILELKVTRARPYELSLSVDNYLPPSIGSTEVRLDGLVRNLTGYGDTLSLSARKGSGSLAVNGDGSWGVSGRFTIPIDRYDTKLWVRAEDVESSIIEERLKDLDIESKVKGVEVGIIHPFYRTVTRTFRLGTALDVRRNDSTLLKAPFSFSPGAIRGKTKVTALRLVAEFTDRNPRQVLSARSTVSVGLDAFGATNHDNGLPDSQFLAWLGQVQYAHRVLKNGAQLLLRADLQLSDDSLLPLEQIPIGGRYTVRGYRENELVRDQGFIASIEFRYPLLAPGNALSLPGSLQLVPFVDYGYGWNKRGFPSGEGALGDGLWSAGVGFQWTWEPHLYAELFLAHAFDRTPKTEDHDLQDDGVEFRVSASF